MLKVSATAIGAAALVFASVSAVDAQTTLRGASMFQYTHRALWAERSTIVRSVCS